MELVEVTSTVFDPWYVVFCKSTKEIYAANILKKQLGVTIYVPEIEVCLRKETRRIPFFSGYFFIQVDLQRVGLCCINSSPGVLKLLCFGESPLEVPRALIETIQEEVSKRSNGSNVSCQKLSPGDSVRVTSGPLEGLRAVFVETMTSDERACILLHVLGRLSKVQLDVNSLENLGTGEDLCLVSTQRERRTRGKGRRINRTDTMVSLS